MISTIYFTECEHNGDLCRYIDDLSDCGATIISSGLDEDDETGFVKIEIDKEKKQEFLNKFKQTDSYEFSNLS